MLTSWVVAVFNQPQTFVLCYRYQERFVEGSDEQHESPTCLAMHHVDSQSKISIDSDYFQRASLYPKKDTWVFDIKVPKSYRKLY